VVWPHGSEQLQNFLSHVNNLRPSFQLTVEIKSGSEVPFLDILVIREVPTLVTKVYRKTLPTLANISTPVPT
jgi:hypothetical protein